MDLHRIIVAVHLIGFVLGMGGATVSDLMFFKAMRRHKLSQEHFAFLQTLSRIIWVGISVLILSGAAILVQSYWETGAVPILATPRFQAKLTLVAIVFFNGLFFKFAIFPKLKQLVDQTLTMANLGPLLWRLAASGTISILSWYSIFLITQTPRSLQPPYLYYIAVYLVLLIIGVMVSRTMLAITINKKSA